MELQDEIDAALAEAERRGAMPFRLDLHEAQIEALDAAGLLEIKAAEMDSSRGGYRGVRVYPAGKASELLVQPADQLLALHLPIRNY